MKELFGRQLKMNIHDLQRAMGERTFYRFVTSRGVTPEMIRNLENGVWKEISHETLFILTSLAEKYKQPAVATSADSPIWKMFREGDENYVLYGTDSKGRQIDVDFACANNIVGNVGAIADKVSQANEQWALDLLLNANVVCVGGPKYNRATAAALKMLEEDGGPSVRFYPYGSAPLEKGPAGNAKGVWIDGHKYEENATTHAEIGVFVAFRHRKRFTTIVVAGCSADATRSLTKDLTSPLLYGVYDPNWDLSEMPALILGSCTPKEVDPNGSDFSWELLSPKRPRKKPGPKRGR